VKAVVDTNVVAYYLLGTAPFAAESRKFWRSVTQACAPAHWEAELANVVWMAVRTGAVPAGEGHRKLDWAARLGIEPVSARSLWQPALALSLTSGAAVYDTLFIALAMQRKLPLATFDKAVLKAFPEIARRPSTLA
jgi:predicted nucleic acid-binding protein